MASQAVSVQPKTVALRPAPPPNTAVGGKPVAVVVGAGPAGVAAAAALATRGFSVEVFERREELTNTTKSRRGYPMVLNGRSTSTLEMAGLDLGSIGATVPQEGMVFNGTAIMRYPQADGKAGSAGPSYVVDRQSLGHGMYKAVASQQHAGSNNIRWHWGQGLDALDLEARCAWFKSQTPTGDAVQTAVSYDLLVGADGYQSAVRQTLEKEQVLDTESLVVSQGTYKTFHNLEVTEESELFIPGLRTHAANQYVYFFVKPGMPSLTMWKADGNTMSGMLGGSVGYGDKELTTALKTMIPSAPEDWRASMVSQTHEGAGQPPAPFGQVLKVSQFHGPNCVLLGDAAHPVTSGLSQGCNLALESVRVFINTLDSVGLDAAPAAFTKARLPDAHAFQTLEFSQVMVAAKQPTIIKGQNRMPSPIEKGLALLLLQLSWAPALALHRLLPAFFSQPALLSGILRNQQIPFSKALATLRLQAGLVAASAIAGLMIAANLATKLAAAVLTKVAIA